MDLYQLNNIRHENIEFSSPNVIERPPYRHRRSPIIVTLGDPKITEVDIQKLIELGTNAVRFKMTFCSKGDKIKVLNKVDKAIKYLCKKHGVLDFPLTTCVQLKTSIVKTGILEGDEEFITLKEGSHVILTYNLEEFDKCTASKIFVDNPFLTIDVTVGLTIVFGNDEIEMKCKKIIDDKSIKCVITRMGQLTSLMYVFLRQAETKTRTQLSKKDLQIVRFALEYQVDMIIVNYAREKETLQKIKAYIGDRKRPIILAGISTPKGLGNIDDLIKESDGLVFSREFLTFELDESLRYRLLHIQKWACAKCQQAGKPFFISGGVFKKALTCGEFCDNEEADVTNALLDGATGFVLKECPDVKMLFGVVKAINKLCCSIEPLTNTKKDFWRVLEGIPMPLTAAEACAVSCAAVAHQCKARLIVIPTVTGDTAKILMRLRTACLVITVSTKKTTTRRLKSFRSVIPMLFEGGTFKNWHAAIEGRVQFAIEYAVKVGWLTLGDYYVTLQRGTENSAFCDSVRAWEVTISKKANVECPDDERERRRTLKSSINTALFN